jgi:hypothetical protein
MRQGSNIFWYAFIAPFHFKWGQWYGFVTWVNDIVRCFKSEYFWQDSFCTHYKRLFGCKHKHVSTALGYSGNYDIKFCFDCYREVK